jgi:hypothetical protein
MTSNDYVKYTGKFESIIETVLALEGPRGISLLRKPRFENLATLSLENDADSIKHGSSWPISGPPGLQVVQRCAQ